MAVFPTRLALRCQISQPYPVQCSTVLLGSAEGSCPAYLLLMAESSTQGMLVAPSTRIPSLLLPTPAQRNSRGDA